MAYLKNVKIGQAQQTMSNVHSHIIFEYYHELITQQEI